jgi:CRP-like cAMP-binding protein
MTKKFAPNELDAQHTYIIFPYSTFAVCWTAVLICLTAIIGIIVPIGFVYLSRDDGWNTGFATIFTIADVWFLMDIVVNFRTAIATGAYPVADPAIIARRYAKSWMVFDILSAWPVLTAPAGSNFRWAVCALKLLRCLKLHVLFRGLRKVYRTNVLPLGEVALFVVLLSHILACVWRAVQRYEENYVEDPRAAWWHLYIADLYWVQMTMTTVGYGDIYPTGAFARAYCILAMLVASMLFGATISFLTNASKSLFDDEAENRVADAIRFMRRRNVPEELQRRVQHNLRHRLKQDQHTNQQDLLKLLSPAVQRDLSLSLLNQTFLQFPLFMGAQHSFMAEIAQEHMWVQCLPGDVLGEQGQVVQEMVFLTRGQLMARYMKGNRDQHLDLPSSQVAVHETESGGVQRISTATEDSESPSESDSADDIDVDRASAVVEPMAMFMKVEHEAIMESGAWFGESCLFDLKHVRAATIVAATESEVAVLPGHAYMAITGKYPKLLQQHRAIEAQLRDGTLDIHALAYIHFVINKKTHGRYSL